jgi:hypothetical protein
MKGREYVLELDAARGENRFRDEAVEARFHAADHALVGIHVVRAMNGEWRLDLWAYHTLRHLWAGVMDGRRVNQVNVTWAP